MEQKRKKLMTYRSQDGRGMFWPFQRTTHMVHQHPAAETFRARRHGHWRAMAGYFRFINRIRDRADPFERHGWYYPGQYGFGKGMYRSKRPGSVISMVRERNRYWRVVTHGKY